MRHWINVAELYCLAICNKFGLSMPFSGFYLPNCCLNLEYFSPQTPPKQQKTWKKSKKQNGWHRSIDSNPISGRLVSYV